MTLFNATSGMVKDELLFNKSFMKFQILQRAWNSQQFLQQTTSLGTL